MLATDDICGAKPQPLYNKPCRCLHEGDPVEEIKGSKPKKWTWLYVLSLFFQQIPMLHLMFLIWKFSKVLLSSKFLDLISLGVTWVDFIFLIWDFTASVSHFFASSVKVLVSSLAEWSFQIVEASSGGNWIIGDTTMTCGISILGRGTRDLFERENPIHWNLYTQLKLLRLTKWVWYSSCDSHEWTNKPPHLTSTMTSFDGLPCIVSCCGFWWLVFFWQLTKG
jgi:hypothetical protein